MFRNRPHLRQHDLRLLHATRRSICARFLYLAVLAPLLSVYVSAEPGRNTEYNLKVAYLYNFTRYVSWPETAFASDTSPFAIGVLGNDPLGYSLDKLAAKKLVQGRPIVVHRFADADEYRECHILFIARSTSEELHREAIERTQGQPVLVVGETPGFARGGATISFFNDSDGTIGMEINVDAVQHRNLQADAKLLKIASIVRSSH